MPKRFEPAELLETYERIQGAVSTEDLFNRPRHSKTLELWVAGQMGLGFNNCCKPCAVWIDEADKQIDFDFELEVEGQRFPFQATEVQEPGRRRGLEYRNQTRFYSTIEDWSPGTNEGPEWIRIGIEKKARKNYSNAESLNLVLYLNYPAYEQKYEVIRDHCQPQASAFASVWLVTGNAICCIQENPALGSIDGWCVFTQYKHLNSKEHHE